MPTQKKKMWVMVREGHSRTLGPSPFLDLNGLQATADAPTECAPCPHLSNCHHLGEIFTFLDKFRVYR